MISDNKNGNGTFSADVKLHLYVGQQQYKLGHLGPGFALLGDTQSIDTRNGDGEIETIVDSKVTRWPIRITSELDGSTRRFEFESVG